jgi:hypothetical protein
MAIAMAYALIFPEATNKGRRGKKNPVTELPGFLQQVKLARAVIREFGVEAMRMCRPCRAEKSSGRQKTAAR